MEAEVRFIETSAELRAAEDGEPTGIAGVAAVFDRPTLIGGMFEERIAPGAFDDVLGGDVRALYNHDANMVLGRTTAGTLKLSVDKQGLRYEVPVLPKARADVLEAVGRGDVTGSSFSFVVAENGEEWTQRKDELPLRTITRLARLPDVGPVTYPAYAETAVSARSVAKAAEMQGVKVDCAGHRRLLDASLDR